MGMKKLMIAFLVLATCSVNAQKHEWNVEAGVSLNNGASWSYGIFKPGLRLGVNYIFHREKVAFGAGANYLNNGYSYGIPLRVWSGNEVISNDYELSEQVVNFPVSFWFKRKNGDFGIHISNGICYRDRLLLNDTKTDLRAYAEPYLEHMMDIQLSYRFRQSISDHSFVAIQPFIGHGFLGSKFGVLASFGRFN